MKLIKNIKAIKSTILGTILIALGIYIIIYSTRNGIDINNYVVTALIGSGIGLWFCPDRYINALEKLVLGREIKLNNTDKDESEQA